MKIEVGEDKKEGKKDEGGTKVGVQTGGEGGQDVSITISEPANTDTTDATKNSDSNGGNVNDKKYYNERRDRSPDKTHKNDINQAVQESIREDRQDKGNHISHPSDGESINKNPFETIIEMDEPKSTEKLRPSDVIHDVIKEADLNLKKITGKENGVVPHHTTGGQQVSIPGTVEGATPPTKRVAIATDKHTAMTTEPEKSSSNV